MSEETPGSTGSEDSTPPPEPPTQPTAAATPPPAGGPAPAPAGEKGPYRFEVPRWAAVALVAVLLLGVGFAIGWIAAPGGGGSHDEIQIGRGLPGRVFPGGQNGGQNGGQVAPVPGATNGAFLGVSTQAAANGQQGAPIAAVQSGSPADQAGLKVGDVITAVDGSSVTDPSQLSQDIRSHQIGDQVTITYTRNGTSAPVQVKLGSRAPVQIG